MYPPHTHFLCHSTKISINITKILQKNLNFKNPTGNATFFKIFHRESSGIEILKRNSNWKLIILCNLPKSSAGIFLSNVTGSNWNHTWYQNLHQCWAGTCIKLTNIFRLDLTSNPTGIGIPLSFFHRGGVDFKWNSPFFTANSPHVVTVQHAYSDDWLESKRFALYLLHAHRVLPNCSKLAFLPAASDFEVAQFLSRNHTSNFPNQPVK